MYKKITDIEITKLETLKIPFHSLFCGVEGIGDRYLFKVNERNRIGSELEVIYNTGTIIGALYKDIIEIKDIICIGIEDSDEFYDFFELLLENSTGILVATFKLEDSLVSQLTSTQGQIVWEKRITKATPFKFNDIEQIEPGMKVMNRDSKETCIVTRNFGDRATAVKTIDITAPSEWVRVG